MQHGSIRRSKRQSREEQEQEQASMTGIPDTSTQTNRFLTLPELVSTSGSLPVEQPFDPEAGVTVAVPPGEGPGWWVGAPGAFWDGAAFYLAFRTRRPQPERGGMFQIARSVDGETFDIVATIRKEDLGAPSIERGAIVQTGDGRWRLYLSFVDPADDRWRIDLLEADTPEHLSAANRLPILTAADIGGEGVKDPWVCQIGETWHMLASFAPTPTGDVDRETMHGTRDIYNTGTSKSLTGLATSPDGIAWTWQGAVFEPSTSGWDAYAARINTVYVRDGAFIALYDGSRSVQENYEERCGIATSTDFRSWARVSVDGPAVGPNGGPGSVRYAEAVQTAGWTRVFYEYTRPDGSHELRTILIDR
jgi:hypothetical protein